MNRSTFAAAGAFAAALAAIGTAAFAQGAPAAGTTATTPPQPAPPHDSNTLHKIGKAIQYPVRKAGENLSKNTHTTTNSKSVVRNRTTGNNYAVKPSGHSVLKSSTNPYVKRAHRRHRRHHRYHSMVR